MNDPDRYFFEPARGFWICIPEREHQQVRYQLLLEDMRKRSKPTCLYRSAWAPYHCSTLSTAQGGLFSADSAEG